MFRIIFTCPQETQSQIINKIRTTPLAQHQKAPPTKNGYKNILGWLCYPILYFKQMEKKWM
jgi:hypothetical protein